MLGTFFQQIQPLLEQADAARRRAYAPYSGFRVGACVLTDTGKTFTGCNVENASYGATICAERAAIAQAVSAGEKYFRTIVIVSDAKEPTVPCGICRQVLCEFSPHMHVVAVADDLKTFEVFQASELLPHAFSARHME